MNDIFALRGKDVIERKRRTSHRTPPKTHRQKDHGDEENSWDSAQGHEFLAARTLPPRTVFENKGNLLQIYFQIRFLLFRKLKYSKPDPQIRRNSFSSKRSFVDGKRAVFEKDYLSSILIVSLLN